MLVPAEGQRAIARDLAGRIDALLLTGGRGLAARDLVRNPRPTLETTDPARYWFEHALVLAACDRRMPVLGICRGMQMLNEALGGTLVLNLALDWPGAIKHTTDTPETLPHHRIEVAPGSHLAGVLGEASTPVNSLHRQAVAMPGVGLKAVAWAPDGVIEAIEGPREGPFLVGVQFHPETLARKDRRWLGLFGALIAAARDRTT